MFLSTGCSLLRAEGFSCSLGVLYGGLGISKQQVLIKKIEIKFSAINFFQFQVIQTLDSDQGSGSAIRKNAGSGSGSALNQCGSETLTGNAYKRQNITQLCLCFLEKRSTVTRDRLIYISNHLPQYEKKFFITFKYSHFIIALLQTKFKKSKQN